MNRGTCIQSLKTKQKQTSNMPVALHHDFGANPSSPVDPWHTRSSSLFRFACLRGECCEIDFTNLSRNCFFAILCPGERASEGSVEVARVYCSMVHLGYGQLRQSNLFSVRWHVAREEHVIRMCERNYHPSSPLRVQHATQLHQLARHLPSRETQIWDANCTGLQLSCPGTVPQKIEFWSPGCAVV